MFQKIYESIIGFFTPKTPQPESKPRTPIVIKGTHEPNKTCTACQQHTVYYLDSDCLNGNPSTPASDTDVLHHYQCANCAHEWSSYC